MLSFLEETIQTIQKDHEDISECILVLPSKRAGGFLKHYLQKHTQKAIFAPKIISIEEYIEELSNLKILPADELLVKSYQAYLTTSGIKEKERFEAYASWSSALLNDFSEIDRYRVPQKAFFDYLSSIKTLEKWGVKNSQTPLIENYLQFWNHLYEFYTELNQLLLYEGTGYQGMVYRKAAEDIEHYISRHGSKKHFFIGFNALNTSEKHIIQELLETGNTTVFWDVDAHFYQDQQHSASLFIRSYFQDWKYYQNHPIPDIPSHYTIEKDITIVEAQNNIVQVKYLGELLVSYSEEKLNSTAIVLADETLLVPVLYSLPPNVKQANVTMGQPLRVFPSTQFFESLLNLHLKPKKTFYFKSVAALLNHPISRILLEDPKTILSKITVENRAYLSVTQLLEIGGPNNEEVLNILFGNWKTDGRHALDKCLQLLEKLKEDPLGTSMEHLVWRKLEEVFKRISALSESHSYLQHLNSVHSIFTSIVPTLSLDFEGDAYTGLQIMGVLETRSLDFENIIMLSVNEGTLPAGKSNASFITYDLKKQFGLPLYTEKDAVYTYHFYRLLHRVQSITLTYSSYTKGLTSGEKSRYLLQLEIENLQSHKLRFKTIETSVSIQKKESKQVAKTEAVMERLSEIGARYFSPSALSNYVRNPMDFYYQKVLKINEAQEVEETVAYSTLGSIVHDTLENLYRPFIGKPLTVKELKALEVGIEAEVKKQFQKHFGAGDYSRGKNLIIFEVAKRYVKNLIQYDSKEVAAGNTIIIKHIESELKTPISLPQLPFPVYLGGKVDRVDMFNDTLRIIDYKTGRVNPTDVEIIDWDDITLDYKYSKAFQVLCYALLMQREFSFQNMEAGIISFKNLNAGFQKFAKKEKPRSSSKHTQIDAVVLDEFTVQLKKLLMEICDPDHAFVEKEIKQ